MPTIRIDDEVWEWLKSHAQPLEDTPNSVLRRIASLDKDSAGSEADRRHPKEQKLPEKAVRRNSTMVRPRELTARQLNREWGVGARHALYHKDSRFYNLLTDFPGALFDPDGYLLFKTREEYENCEYLQRGKRLTVPGLISSVPGYKRMR